MPQRFTCLPTPLAAIAPAMPHSPQRSYHFAARKERSLSQSKGKARPNGHHAAKTKGGTHGIKAYASIAPHNIEYAGHQAPICAHIVALYLWHNLERKSHAQHHHKSCDEEHFAPTQPFANITANHSRCRECRLAIPTERHPYSCFCFSSRNIVLQSV